MLQGIPDKVQNVCQILECQKICHIVGRKCARRYAGLNTRTKICQTNGLEHRDKECQKMSQIEYKILCVEFEWIARFAGS